MLKIPFRIAASKPALLRRAVMVVILSLFFAVAGVFLSLRYAVLPDIEHYHKDITDAVSTAIGMSVQIGKIEADWRGLGPHLRLTDIRLLDSQQRTSLELKRVDAVVSWMTILARELRLSSLEIDQPDLMVKRDALGGLQISGVRLGGQSSDNQSSDNNFANMLLHQSRIVIRDAHISWLDEQQAKPMLVFERVNLVIENSWNRHRFAFRAIPPAELSSQLDVRGNFYGRNFDNLQDWSGELFTQLDYANLPQWKTWLPLPDALKQGRGALRGWLGVEDGKVNRITADLGLVNVQTRLASDLPPLDIRVMSGRLGWHSIENGFEISTRKLLLKLFDNFELKPTDVFFSLSNLQDLRSSSGEVRANLLELDGMSKLAGYFPLEQGIKDQLAEFLPRGDISDLQAKWNFDAAKQLHFKVKSKFSELALQHTGKLPGFSGLSGELDGNENSGTLSLTAHNLKLDAPQIMPEPLSIDAFSAKSTWLNDEGGLEVNIRNIAVANKDIAGTAYGSYQTMPDSPGKVDLTVHLTRASVANAGKYIPLVALGADMRNWLDKALLAGQCNDFNLRLKGNMNDFPFADNRNGIFKVQLRASGVGMQYAPEWPRIENANVDFSLHGKGLEVSALSATTAGINLKNVKVSIPDVLSKELLLSVKGDAEAENSRALGYVKASPVHGYLGGVTDDIVASGKGRLNLKLEIPLSGNRAATVAGTYHVTDSDIEVHPLLPTLRKLNGDVSFTGSSVSSNNIAAQILGGPAKLLVEPGDDGAINVKLAGKANFDVLREANPNPLLRKLHGEPVWNVDIGIKNKLSRILLTANLAGLKSDLPAPLSKKADEGMPIRFEMTDTSSERKAIALQVGSLLNANLVQFRDRQGEWKIRRGLVNFGNVPQKADRDGLWIIGTLPKVSLDGWEGMPTFGSGGEPINLAGSDLLIQQLIGQGYLFRDLHIRAHSRSGLLSAQIASKDLNGDVSWQAAGEEPDDNGMLVAKLKNLDLNPVEGEAIKNELPSSGKPAKKAAKVDLPAIDLNIDKLSLKGRQLGRMELQAQQDEASYRVERFRLLNQDGTLTMDGLWKMSEDEPQTKVNVNFDISNAGNILARYGYPNTVKNGSGKLEGSFAWSDTPAKFNMEKLDGTLSLDTGKGQFQQFDPGIGKLLSILSLQALPKHITLDFDDVFSKGFEFDSIKGSADIKQGVLTTDNLKIEGSAAKVSMKGQMDLVNETQNLKVHIVPTVGNSVALISALMATPVVGAGVYLAGKILDDPLGQLASFEYNVSGSWANPKVEKAGENKSEKTN